MTLAPQSELLDHKFDMCFGHADQNKDGVVDAADILTFAARVIAAVNEPFDSPKATEMLRVCQNWWEGMASELDTDKDGKIDPLEYRVGMRRLVGSKSSFDAASRPVATAIWKLCDRDDDGEVSARSSAPSSSPSAPPRRTPASGSRSSTWTATARSRSTS